MGPRYRICCKSEIDDGIQEMRRSALGELYSRVLPELYEAIPDNEVAKMNYVAYAMYKHKLRHMRYVDAQYFCIKVVSYQSERLIHSLRHAVKMTRPDMIWWFDKLVKAGL